MRQLIIGLIGFTASLSVLAFPAAPPGPYQSLEDDFIRTDRVHGSESNPQKAKNSVQPTQDKKTIQWDWGAAPAVRPLQSNPGQQLPANAYPDNSADISR